MNYDQWKLASPPYEEDVSPCCGAEYSEDVISNCCGVQIVHERCTDCGEGADPEDIYICAKCDEPFDEPISEYEYNENMRESWAEMRMDEERLNRG